MDNWMTATLALAGSVVTAIGTAFTMGRARSQDQRAALQALVDSGVQKHELTCPVGNKLASEMEEFRRENRIGHLEIIEKLSDLKVVVTRVQGSQERLDVELRTAKDEINRLRNGVG